jgi:epoxide hydrolase-like predicted phosphatase
MAIRAVIWDVGGVLVRTEDQRSRDRLAERFGLSRSELEELVFGHEAGKRAQRGEVSYEAHWEILGKELRLSPGNIEEFQRAFWAGDKLDHELINYIRSLRGRYKTGLLSNAFSDLRHMVEAVWKIGDAFDVLVISAEVGVVKPDPQIYQIALEKLGVDAQEAVFIDDFDRNVAAARELNLHGIHFRNPVQVRADLNDLL